MNKLKKRMLYGITIAVVIFSIVWNSYMNQWLAERHPNPEAVVRVDLFVLYPAVITLLALFIYHMRKKS